MSKQQPLYPAVSPIDYLDIAERLTSWSEPCAYRTAADRIYYSTFLFSRDNLAEKNYIVPHYGSEDHIYVENALKRRDVLGTFGNEENRLRRARNCITYDNRDLYLGRPESVRPLDWMLNAAKEIIKRVEALPVNPVPR